MLFLFLLQFQALVVATVVAPSDFGPVTKIGLYFLREIIVKHNIR